MTPTHLPRLPFAILRMLDADQAFIGDLVEEFEERRSRSWLWRQVLGAVPELLLGRTRAPKPHHWRPVNLSGAPAGSPVGGLGLLTLAVIVGFAPGLWLLLAVGLTAGSLLALVLIGIGRHQQERSSRDRNVLHL